jgi:hypothetical protein
MCVCVQCMYVLCVCVCVCVCVCDEKHIHSSLRSITWTITRKIKEITLLKQSMSVRTRSINGRFSVLINLMRNIIAKQFQQIKISCFRPIRWQIISKKHNNKTNLSDMSAREREWEWENEHKLGSLMNETVFALSNLISFSLFLLFFTLFTSTIGWCRVESVWWVEQ